MVNHTVKLILPSTEKISSDEIYVMSQCFLGMLSGGKPGVRIGDGGNRGCCCGADCGTTAGLGVAAVAVTGVEEGVAVLASSWVEIYMKCLLVNCIH